MGPCMWCHTCRQIGGIPEGRPDGREPAGVTGPSTLIKNGLVSLLSETLLLGVSGLCGLPGYLGTESPPQRKIGCADTREHLG